MKKKIMSIVLSLALVMGMMISLTSVSFAADPTITPYFDHIVISGLDDNLSYSIEVKKSKGEPGPASEFSTYYGGKCYYGYGELKPNTSYYLYLCIGSASEGQTSEWKEYTFKTLKVPTPSVNKIVVGKKSMTVKIKTKLDSGTKYTIQYSAKGVAKKTKTYTPGEKDYSNPSVKIGNLKKGKKYTVKVMATTYDGYKTGWSKAKTSGKIK